MGGLPRGCVFRPGVPPRTGPPLADGDVPPHRRGTPERTLRRGHGRDGPLPEDRRLPARRRTDAGGAPAGERRPRRSVRERRQCGDLELVRTPPPRVRPAAHPPGAVGCIADLLAGEDHGVGPGRLQRGARTRPCAPADRGRGAGGPPAALPAVGRHDPGGGAGRAGAVGHDGLHPGAGPRSLP